MKYKRRIADLILAEKLEEKGAILIRGPKWCGKTTTAEQFAGSIIYLDQPGKREENIELARLDPGQLLNGKTPRMIDEWQIAPQLWDAVRFEVDHRRKTGQFILTGSAVPIDKNNLTSNKIFHSGVGRYAYIDMLPMSLYESGESTGEVSLGELFKSPESISGSNKLALADIAYLICRGGWPFATSSDLSRKASLNQAYDYLDLVVEEDISRVDNITRNPQRARQILRSYARFQGSQTPVSKIRQDLISNETDTLSDDTVAAYLNSLRQIFVIQDMKAWNPNITSKTAIRTTDTRYFSDPSIAAASLGFGPEDLINDLFYMGFAFETLCVRDLRVYTQALGGDVYHYRDSNGLECDAIIHLRNGRFGLIEIKLGGEKLISDGVETLSKFASIIDTKKMGAPSFKMILTAVGSYAYKREDGIYIVPIGCLKN